MKRDKYPIDIAIPWVDPGDPVWQEEKTKYAKLEGRLDLLDIRDNRYRDWDTIRYLFRSVEKNIPWVNKVFFITYGHLPSWMNVKAEKLVIIRHEEFIPREYLPTFNVNPIELNLHRIAGLSEHFVYFNDDLLIMKPLEASDFFRKGLPCDYALLNPISTASKGSIHDITLSDMEIINTHFDKKNVIRKNPQKWFSLQYGRNIFRSMCVMPWPYFVGFLMRHQCNAFLKSTFEEVWKHEYSVLDATCRHRFRTRRDVNQWLMRYWQIASGNFEPIRPYGKIYGITDNDNSKLFQAIDRVQDKTIVINDNVVKKDTDVETIKTELIRHLNARFPEKSSFEL